MSEQEILDPANPEHADAITLMATQDGQETAERDHEAGVRASEDGDDAPLYDRAEHAAELALEYQDDHDVTVMDRRTFEMLYRQAFLDAYSQALRGL